jgi:uncharacterized protein DUF4372
MLSLVDRHRFERLVREHRAERGAKGFGSWSQFVAMMFCQLAQAKSLREIIVIKLHYSAFCRQATQDICACDTLCDGDPTLESYGEQHQFTGSQTSVATISLPINGLTKASSSTLGDRVGLRRSVVVAYQ